MFCISVLLTAVYRRSDINKHITFWEIIEIQFVQFRKPKHVFRAKTIRFLFMSDQLGHLSLSDDTVTTAGGKSSSVHPMIHEYVMVSTV